MTHHPQAQPLVYAFGPEARFEGGGESLEPGAALAATYGTDG